MSDCFLNGCWVGAKTSLDEVVIEVILLVIRIYVRMACVCSNSLCLCTSEG